ncbi:MAG: hypothetical protein KAJ54_03330 [Candidatus Aenigmarchaeota archaeon]|nr:hypothetical protein [Candidatus Aenigmarchaeota archaeon]MCK5321977.1 hypothetical protein [Candidatus Aenigmarchaeota archaeon]
MELVVENLQTIKKVFDSSCDDNTTKKFVSDVFCGNDVVDCPHCEENSLLLGVHDMKRSQAFFYCLNDKCSAKFRVDTNSKVIEKL